MKLVKLSGFRQSKIYKSLLGCKGLREIVFYPLCLKGMMSTLIDLSSVSGTTLLMIRTTTCAMENYFGNASPVCDTADLQVSTLHLSPGSYKQLKP